MGKSSNRAEASPSLQKYGVPFYAAAWLPYNQVRSHVLESQSQSPSESAAKEQEQQEEAHRYYVVLAGGGGEGRSGIPNAILLAHFDHASNSLSPEPVAKLGIGSDLPYRMAVHPGGGGLICALPKSCRFFEWDEVKDNEDHKVGLKLSEKVLSQLEDVGQQLALAFNNDGSVLAAGGEDGNLRVLKWPSMEIILSEAEAHTSIKDLCFSPDGKFLISLGGRGPGRVWDVTSSTAVASLVKENDEIFASCRFSQISDKTQVLYIAAITGKGGSIVTWNTSSWTRMSSKHIIRDPVSSFDVSPDGKFLAVGTAQGDVLLVNSVNMRVQTMVRKAHLGMVTALAFSHDSRALVSASMDSSARVMLVEDKKIGMSSIADRIRARMGVATQGPASKRRRLQKELVASTSSTPATEQQPLPASVLVPSRLQSPQPAATEQEASPVRALMWASGSLQPILRASSPPGGVGSSATAVEGDIYVPPWGVREKSSVQSRTTAREIGTHCITPYDRDFFPRVKVEDLVGSAQCWIGQLGAAVHGLARSAITNRDSVKVLQAELSQAKEQLARKETAYAATLAEKEAVSASSRAALNALKEELERRVEELRKCKEDVRARDELVAELRQRSEDDLRAVRAELGEAPAKAIWGYKESASFIDEVMASYATCWEDAGALCREQGQEDLALLMDGKAEQARATIGCGPPDAGGEGEEDSKGDTDGIQ